MKKIKVKGNAVKELRQQLERLSTQKELSNEIGVGIRTLRKIENENAAIGVSTLDRLAKALGVHRESIIFSLDSPKLVQTGLAEIVGKIIDDDEDRLIPRYDYDIATVTSDEGRLYAEAVKANDLSCVVETKLSDETAAYAEELFEILKGLSRDDPATDEMIVRRRLRQLLVLLRGNDIWVYETSYHRTLPERDTLGEEGEARRYEIRYVVALGPPGEYGEDSIKVSVDHGRPFVLPAWNKFLEKRKL